MNQVIVAIDGPAGTGKSTVAGQVADRLGLPHLDTGAFYRAATLIALRSGVDLRDEKAVEKVVSKVSLDQVAGSMFADGDDISIPIRDSQVTNDVSVVSAHPKVRKALVDLQRRWVESRGGAAVVEGRDIGTVVFPQARVKVYLDASPEVRARRRSLDTDQPVEQTLEEQTRRDRLDSTRNASPLKIPGDATIIDTSKLTINEVVSSIVSLVKSLSS